MEHVPQYLVLLARKIRAELRILHERLADIHQEIRTANSQSQAQQNQPPAPVVVTVELHKPQSEVDTEKTRSEQEKTDKDAVATRDKRRLLIEALALVAACIVAVYVGFQLDEMQKTTAEAIKATNATVEATKASQEAVQAMREQNELTRKQIAGTMAAYVSFHMYVDLSSDTEMYVRLLASNSGQVPAHDVTGTMRVTLVSFPTKSIVGTPVVMKLPPESLRPVKPDGQVTIEKRYGMPELLNRGTWERVKRGELGLKIEGQFSYGNGFGTPNHKSICVMNMVTYWMSADRTRQLPPRPGGLERIECGEVDGQLARVLRTKALVEDEERKRPPQ